MSADTAERIYQESQVLPENLRAEVLDFIGYLKSRYAIQSGEGVTTDQQVNRWTKIGRIAEQNPDLNFEFIQSVLEAREEALTGQTEPYSFG